MQKSGTLRREKVQVNTGIIPAPKSLHFLAKKPSPCATVEGAGGSAATLRKVVAAFGRHLMEDGKSAKMVESYTRDVAGKCLGAARRPNECLLKLPFYGMIIMVQ